jgi:hypothetical protein
MMPIFGAASAMAPLLQSQQHHVDEINLTNQLHERGIEQARDLHDDAMAQTNELHREAIAQARALHEVEERTARALHDLSISHANDLHTDSKDLSLRLHIEQLEQELLHHKQQMDHAHETAMRENMRDVWEQKARKAETLLITNTLMFGCFFAVLVEGQLAEETDIITLIVYAASLGVCFAFLFLCMWFTMKNQSRMTSFNIYNKEQLYSCGRMHPSFESYYNCHCASVARLASQAFYVGTVALVVAACCYAYARFYFHYRSFAGALIFVIMAGVTLVTVSVLYFFFPTVTRRAPPVGGLPRRLRALRREVDPADTYRGAASLPPADLLGFFTRHHFADPSALPRTFDAHRSAALLGAAASVTAAANAAANAAHIPTPAAVVTPARSERADDDYDYDDNDNTNDEEEDDSYVPDD